MDKTSTYIIESMYEHAFKVEDRLDAAFDVAEALKVDVSELKVLSYNYSRTIRTVEAIGGDEVAAFTVMKKVACGDDLETAASEMDSFLTAVESIEYDYVVLTKGRVTHHEDDVTAETSTQSAKKTTTTTEVTTSRTTRRVDNPPAKLNSLTGFTCVR
ncbi:hypothetical protein ANCCAN_09089 [Ancylostoma caninum]|uniref:Uncharacterized protein n=1 Tax=Ancylostoma caninum TaxID=29170 RepID=A0A368GKJ3_ANCCA|nr:hypothetical protein ANCCAN_09089 [Ancylostoma caninum]